MSTVIAERAVTLQDGGSGFIRMYMPQPDGDAQFCELHLAWPGHEQRQKVYGTDTWQCVLEAIRVAPLFMSLTDDYRQGRLIVFETALNQPLRSEPDSRNALEAFFDVKPHPRDVQ